MQFHLKRWPIASHKARGAFLLALCALSLPAASRADNVTYQITGLFDPEREADLRAAVAKVPHVKLIRIDFKNAEATFEYDPTKVFADVKPQDRLRRFSDILGTASNNTFGAKPLRTLARDKLESIEIGVQGLDCKGCCLAAYEMIYKLEGVEMATVSFKEGRINALVDPTKINRAMLEETLKKRGVELKKP